MSIREILLWLEQCPVLQGEKINWSFLPGYRGWSLTVPKAETKTDILGNSHSVRQLKITRRISIQSNADRLAAAETLEELAAWARDNPPPGTGLRVSGLPEFTARNNSGTEDISITLTLRE